MTRNGSDGAGPLVVAHTNSPGLLLKAEAELASSMTRSDNSSATTQYAPSCLAILGQGGKGNAADVIYMQSQLGLVTARRTEIVSSVSDDGHRTL